jgi:hypothetical protein
MAAVTSTAAGATPIVDARYTAMATPPRRGYGDPSAVSLQSPLPTLTPSEIGTPDPDRTYTHVSSPNNQVNVIFHCTLITESSIFFLQFYINISMITKARDTAILDLVVM